MIKTRRPGAEPETSRRPPPPRRRIGLRSSGVLMTPEEFDETPPRYWDRRFRYELIRGVLIVSPPVGMAEVDPNEELGHWLRMYRDNHPQGSVIDATAPERHVPSNENRRRCDRAIWVGLGRLPDTTHDVPAIVVEFVSAGRRDAVRDYEEKRDEYLAAGVREYWIIDRFRRIMTVYVNGTDGPACRVVAETEAYESPLLPDFVLPLSGLLARADLWQKARPQPQPPTEPQPPAGGSE